jgi:hypothetical protein
LLREPNERRVLLGEATVVSVLQSVRVGCHDVEKLPHVLSKELNDERRCPRLRFTRENAAQMSLANHAVVMTPGLDSLSSSGLEGNDRYVALLWPGDEQLLHVSKQYASPRAV